MSLLARAVLLWSRPTLSQAQALRDAAPEERRIAARQLGDAEAGEAEVAVEALMGALGDPSEEVRAAAIESLGGLTESAYRVKGADPPWGRAVLRMLRESLRDERPAVRAASAGGLRAIYGAAASRRALPPETDRAMEALLITFDDAASEVRVQSGEALAQMAPLVTSGPPRELVTALESDSESTRILAARALGGFTHEVDPLASSLFRAFRRGDGQTRSECGSSLARLSLSAAAVPVFVEGLGDPDRETRFQAAVILSKLGRNATRAVPSLIPVLSAPFDPTWIPRNNLHESYYDPACKAAEALGEIAPGTSQAQAATSALLAILDSPEDWRRRSAIQALAKFRPPTSSTIEILMAAYRRSGGSGDGPALAWTLGHIAPDTDRAGEVVQLLGEALDSDSNWLRSTSATALARFGPEASGTIPRLRTLLIDPDANVRAAAASALRAIEASGAIDRPLTPSG
jgi:HEAT repeat protein